MEKWNRKERVRRNEREGERDKMMMKEGKEELKDMRKEGTLTQFLSFSSFPSVFVPVCPQFVINFTRILTQRKRQVMDLIIWNYDPSFAYSFLSSVLPSCSSLSYYPLSFSYSLLSTFFLSESFCFSFSLKCIRKTRVKIGSKDEGNERTRIDRIISALSCHELSSFYVLLSSSLRERGREEEERERRRGKSLGRHLQKTNERNYTLWKISQISRASSQCLCSVHWTEFKGRDRERERELFLSFSHPFSSFVFLWMRFGFMSQIFSCSFSQTEFSSPVSYNEKTEDEKNKLIW